MSRGLLGVLNTEQEPAGVLAHEVAHVAARHGVHRATAATPFAVLFGLPRPRAGAQALRRCPDVIL